MIIKDKPFHIPACQAMSCAFYYPAGVFLHEVAIPESSSCAQGLVRRWPGFVKLEAYQVRLARIAADRWAELQCIYNFNPGRSSVVAWHRRFRLVDPFFRVWGVL